MLSFLGGGSSSGHVPAVVDEIVNRAEFVTSYGGGPYADLGKYQAIFEFQSLIGELVGMDVCQRAHVRRRHRHVSALS